MELRLARFLRSSTGAPYRGLALAGVILGVLAIGLGVLGIAIVNDAFNDLDQELYSHRQ